jgi:hypothetical protein
VDDLGVKIVFIDEYKLWIATYFMDIHKNVFIALRPANQFGGGVIKIMKPLSDTFVRR